MFSFENIEGQFTTDSPQRTTMFPSPITPVELKMPVPLRPLTIPPVPDIFLEDGSSPATESPGSPSKSPQPKPSSSRRSGAHVSRLSRNRGPDHIPRPPNPFILFACHVRNLPDSKGVNNRELSKRAGDLWNELPDSEKEFWKAEAQKAKESHAQRYPGYRYQPRRRELFTSERSSHADDKKSARASARHRPAPLSLQHEARQADPLYPTECLTSAIDEFEALRASYQTSSHYSTDTQINYPVLSPNGNYLIIPLDHSRAGSRASLPLSPSALDGFHSLSLQSPPINVHYHGVDFSAAYPSPISPPQVSFRDHFPAPLPDGFQQQALSFYEYQ